MKKTRFTGMDLLAAQMLYRELILKFHPDNSVTGDAEEASRINEEWQSFTAHVINEAFAASDGKTRDYTATVFAEMLRHIIRWDIRVEIIGFWIYAFDSFNYHAQLKELGFWFSGKHRAWIYSGGKKRPIRGHYTTDENRARWGSTEVQNELQNSLEVK